MAVYENGSDIELVAKCFVGMVMGVIGSWDDLGVGLESNRKCWAGLERNAGLECEEQ